MRVELDTRDDVVARLRRVHGQVGGIVGMLEAGRSCTDVVRQISAAIKALEQAGFKLVASGMRECARDEGAARRAGYTEADLEKLFMQLA